ncbi:outer membrane protein transport protein [Vibrio genomosp. F10]|uniref:outer membrane protein transport protein n=1 Tax=Vibrio genomosp. F10 TaxID=723171 RepID=UPI0002D802D2|nr:outer membrane protein transport protein [Vibrio genomosp. F10]OEF04949.1 long-chain fatty acid transporter [Vibrio genomosp. F10 str. 9ZB36]
MNNSRLFKKSLLAVTIASASLASAQVAAAGFQLNAQSATGLGRAFAGDAVIADNASVMARNPAAMALFDDVELSLGFVSITSQIEVKDATYSQVGSGLVAADSNTTPSNYSDAGDTSFAPNIHLIVPVNEQFAWGVNAYTNFGTKTEFDDTFVAEQFGGKTEILSMNLGLAGSYRINEQFSVGAGLDLIYGQGTMQRTFKGNDLINVEEADVWGVGFNVGAVYELDTNNRFGLAYRYSPEMEAKDDKGQKITLPLPDMFEFSGFHKIEDTKFAVHYSAQWIGWKAFDEVPLDVANPLITSKEYQWKNAYHLSLGGTYYLNQDWTLRAGYMYDASAQDEMTSVSVPDSDRNWLSAGFTYNIDAKSNIDFGFTYLLGKDVVVEETQAIPVYDPTTGALVGGYSTAINATTHADAILVGLQYSRSF